MNDKAILITIEIEPLKNGKRRVVLSGAPEKEMPVVRAGAFAELHDLIDQVWIALMKRQPQIVTVKVEKPKPAAKPGASKDDKETEGAEGEAGEASASLGTVEEPDQAPDPVEKALDDAGGNAIPEAPEEPDELPVIEGDTTAGQVPLTEEAHE